MKLLDNNSNKVKVKKELEDVISEEIVRRTLKRALRSYSTLQVEDGFWPGDYGGPLFLLPSLVLPFPSLLFIYFIKNKVLMSIQIKIGHVKLDFASSKHDFIKDKVAMRIDRMLQHKKNEQAIHS